MGALHFVCWLIFSFFKGFSYCFIKEEKTQNTYEKTGRWSKYSTMLVEMVTILIPHANEMQHSFDGEYC